jgi:hypothetical protein
MRERAVCGFTGRHIARVLALAALMSLALPAQAQDLDLHDLARVPEPVFVGQGYEMGTFLILPALTVGNSYNDNIFADDGGERGDYVASIIPALGIESLWSRHFVSLGVLGEINRYGDLSSENDEEYRVDGLGRLDLTGASSAVADISLGRRTIRRANSENTGRVDPEQLDFVNFDFTYSHKFGRIRLDLDPFVNRRDYLERIDGDRDRIQFGGTPRVWYRFSPALSIFVEPGVGVLDYDRKVDDGGFERNSRTFRGFVGAKFDVSSIIRGEISVGPVHMDFDDSSFDAFTTVGARGEVSWDLTPLTLVEAEVVRRVSPTNLAGASSKIQSLGLVRVRHELVPDLFLTVDGAYFREDFEGLGREDDNYRIRASAQYLINRFVSIGVGYGFRVRDSNEPAEDCTRNVFTFAIELRL